MLFVPKNDTILRIRYDCSLLCLDDPIQKVASGPDSSLIFFSRSVISSSACFQLMRWYLPLTSFIGVFSRYSPCPCSRMDAPFAQCAPRFSGESNTGSWRTQTPFSTTASIEQPTEQCVQTVRLTSMLRAGSEVCASAFSTMLNEKAPAAAPAPTPTPERFRNVRRSIVVESAERTPRARLAVSAPGAGVAADLRCSSMSRLLVLRSSCCGGSAGRDR